MSRDFEPKLQHPEGLTPSQETLAHMLYSAQIVVPNVPMAEILSDGSRYPFKSKLVTHPLSFAPTGMGFIFKHHEARPEAELAPFKINLRALPKEVLGQIGVVLEELRQDIGIEGDVVAGIPEAGTPLAEAFSKESKIRSVSLFAKTTHPDGTRSIGAIFGMPRELIIVDDVVTEGGTKLEAFKSAQNSLFDVKALLVVIDREQGGIESLRDSGVPIFAAMKATQILDFGLRTGSLSKEHHERALSYIRAKS